MMEEKGYVYVRQGLGMEIFVRVANNLSFGNDATFQLAVCELYSSWR